MKLKIFTLLVFCSAALHAQIFEEELIIDNYEPTEVILPPSPLTVQNIFIGGYDIVQTTETYGNPAGRAIAKEWHDFIGWTADDTDESLGWVTVNHEMIYQDDRIGDGGGMTAFRVQEDGNGGIEVMEQTLDDGRTGQFFNVDFVNTVGETGMNCAGISAPNGRIWTAEEWFRTSNSSINTGNTSSRTLPIHVSDEGRIPNNGVRNISRFSLPEYVESDFAEFGITTLDTIEKWQNFNYMVEVDPRQARAIRKQYNWGRGGWEGGAISNDGRYVYLGDDALPAPFIRLTAATPWDFTDVTVEVYKENNEPAERWIEIDVNRDNFTEDIRNKAWDVGATMYIRNEWVAIDQETGIVYWTETGRESTSSSPGHAFLSVRDGVRPNGESAAGFGVLDGQPNPDVLPASAHFAWADSVGIAATPWDEAYQDYYGRVWWYDPATSEQGVVINGGPFFSNDNLPTIADYPEKHLSNPDGINVMEIDGKSYLLICEDLNQSDWGSMPAEINDGSRNRLCELFLLPADARNADRNDLIRITAIPFGAEVTGAIQISDNTILVNSQHPNAQNPFPYNHSLTMAIHGFADLTVSLDDPSEDDFQGLSVFPNPATRTVFLSEPHDFAIYNASGQRMRVYRNTNQVEVGEFTPGIYYIVTDDKESYKLIIQE